MIPADPTSAPYWAPLPFLPLAAVLRRGAGPAPLPAAAWFLLLLPLVRQRERPIGSRGCGDGGQCKKHCVEDCARITPAEGAGGRRRAFVGAARGFLTRRSLEETLLPKPGAPLQRRRTYRSCRWQGGRAEKAHWRFDGGEEETTESDVETGA